MHFAAFNKKSEVAALLLAHPACDPFVLDRKQGRTPAEDPPAEDTSDDAIRAARSSRRRRRCHCAACRRGR